MMRTLLCAACFLAASAARAAAAPGPPNVTINVDPATQQRETAYKATVAALTPQQQATLKSYESQTLKLLTPEVQVLTTEYQLKACLAQPQTEIAKNGARYQSDDADVRRWLENSDQAEIAALRARQMKDTRFIDQQLVDEHTEYMRQLMLGLAHAQLESSYRQGQFADTDCGATAARLEKSAALARAPAPQADSVAERIAQIKARAANADPDSMVDLGMLLLSGQGVTKDVAAGFAWLERAAATGDARAEFMLGLAYATDLMGRQPDKPKAKYWLGKAAAQGYAKAAQMLPEVDKVGPSETVESLRARADRGDATAEYELGSRYSLGLGVAKDPEQAQRLLLASARQGYSLAESDLAVMLMNDNRVPEGLDWMTKAAAAGVANSQYELGQIYEQGKLAPQDLAKAADWYRKAAASGDPRARQALQRLGG